MSINTIRAEIERVQELIKDAESRFDLARVAHLKYYLLPELEARLCIKVHDKTFVPYMTEAEILAGVDQVATDINRDYSDKRPLLLAVLNGSFMFASDLMKRLTIDCEIQFVKIASYEGTSSTGAVRELIGVSADTIKGRDVIVVEDIVDTGRTMESVLPGIWEAGAKSVEVATLLHKPEATVVEDLKIAYVAHSIPNRFVVGYGLDYDQLGRNLPDLWQLETAEN